MPQEKFVLIVGICGVTCGGKTTLANALKRTFPSSKIISQDDYFLDVDDPRHTWIPELHHINFDIITSLEMEKMYQDIQELVKDRKLITDIPPTKKDTILESKEVDIVIIEGFCIFNYKPLVPLFQLKYYFTLGKEECCQRRNTRVYEPPDCPGYFEMCVWPEHLKQLEEVKTEVPDVRYFNANTQNVLETVLCDIRNYLQF